ncbi:MAG: S1 family peptidase [Scytolyngbya sp. HA4215-MV1]|nr:S1 family peptidase [Scytolyngbya sp. HA4215-MV1]
MAQHVHSKQRTGESCHSGSTTRWCCGQDTDDDVSITSGRDIRLTRTRGLPKKRRHRRSTLCACMARLGT